MRRRSMPNLIGDISQMEERQARLERVLQVIGFTPDKPYTMVVNDGTRNRVEIGKINGDYGIRITDNAGNNIILANGTIIADAITSGTLDCSLITVANLDAGSITTGTLSASYIQGGILDCGTMTVQSLNAASITVGQFVDTNDRFSDTSIHGDKIQTGTLHADRIEANTINSDQIQTHSLSGDTIAFNTLTGGHLDTRTITADRIQVNTITTNEILSMSGAKLVNSTVANAKISDLSATKLNQGILYVGGSGKVSQILLDQSSGYSDAFIRWSGGARIWADGSNRIGINSIGSPMYIYINSYEKIISPEDGQVTIRGGLNITTQTWGSLGYGNLNVAGDARIDGDLTAPELYNTNIYGDNIYYWNLIYYSDERLKKNIKPMVGSLANILKLKPVEFERKTNKKKFLGFLAQDVEKVLPELVSTGKGKDKDIMGVDITQMIPMLIGAVQELSDRLEKIESLTNI